MKVDDDSFRCLDCNTSTLSNKEYPLMLQDELWLSIVPNGIGMLCKSCMEQRLGRKLTKADFMFETTWMRLNG
jgi:hypothetical protein